MATLLKKRKTRKKLTRKKNRIILKKCREMTSQRRVRKKTNKRIQCTKIHCTKERR